VLLQSLGSRLLPRQPSSDRAGLLWPEVERLEWVALVEFTKILSSLLVHYRQDPGDGPLHDRYPTELPSRSISDLVHPKINQFPLQLIQMLQ